jgi:hypothetical protein
MVRPDFGQGTIPYRFGRDRLAAPGGPPLDELSALPPDARRRVARAVAQGAALTDRAEARAAVALARRVQTETVRRPWVRRRLGVTVISLAALAVVVWFLSRQVLMAVAAPLIAGGVLLLNDGWTTRRIALARTAEQRNAAVAAQPPEASPPGA